MKKSIYKRTGKKTTSGGGKNWVTGEHTPYRTIYNKHYKLSDDFLLSITEKDIANIYTQESAIWKSYKDGDVVFVVYSGTTEKYETISYVEIYKGLQWLCRNDETRSKAFEIIYLLERKVGEFRAGIFKPVNTKHAGKKKRGRKQDFTDEHVKQWNSWFNELKISGEYENQEAIREEIKKRHGEKYDPEITPATDTIEAYLRRFRKK